MVATKEVPPLAVEDVIAMIARGDVVHVGPHVDDQLVPVADVNTP